VAAAAAAAAPRYRADHSRQRLLAAGNVLEHRPRVREIEGGLRQRVGEDVVPQHFQVVAALVIEDAGIEVGGHHPAAGSHLPGQPQRHAARAAADFEALPAGADAQVTEVPDRRRVEQVLERQRRSRSAWLAWEKT
jgi:hypothetical protein